jgi:hypothetical protein
MFLLPNAITLLGFQIVWLWASPDEGYSQRLSCPLNLIFTHVIAETLITGLVIQIIHVIGETLTTGLVIQIIHVIAEATEYLLSS